MKQELEFRATVVIPTYNEGMSLVRVVRAVLGQTTPWPFELLLIDSTSTDGSPRCLEGTPARRLTIPHERFNHGETRNIGAQSARGTFVVFLVADALPESNQWLRHLVEALEDHPGAVGGYARQRAWENADPTIQKRIDAWTPQGNRPSIKRIASADAFRKLDPMSQIRLAAFDNVCSIVRREHLLKHPFSNVPFGEDILWGREQLLAGHTLLYIPTAVVRHSHERSMWEHLNRARMEHQMLIQAFGLQSVSTLPALLRQSLGVALEASGRGFRGAHRQLGETLGQYLAGRNSRK